MVYWVKSSGEVMTVHQPEVLAASGVRNEVTMIPMVGISHSRQSTSRTILTTGEAFPGRLRAPPPRGGAVRPAAA